MIKVIGLPSSVRDFPDVVFPFADGPAHPLVMRECQPSVHMIGHKQEKQGMPSPVFVVMTHGLQQDRRDCWLRK